MNEIAFPLWQTAVSLFALIGFYGLVFGGTCWLVDRYLSWSSRRRSKILNRGSR
jgi:hypothetical protein